MTEMNTSVNIKKYLPHLAAVAAFVIVSIVYFSPALRGDRIFQSDMSHFEGMSKELKDYNEQSGKRAGWTNSMFSGMPSYQIMGPETQNVFDTVKKPLTLWGLDFNAGILFLMMLGFYVFMSVMGAGPLVSFFASVAYALGSYNIIIIGVGHITKAWAMAMMAPVLAGMILCFRKKYLSGAALFTFALGMQIYFNHIQITYYNLIAALVLGACYMVYAIREKQVKDFLKSCALLLCCALLALMPNSTHLLLNSEYDKVRQRLGQEHKRPRSKHRLRISVELRHRRNVHPYDSRLQGRRRLRPQTGKAGRKQNKPIADHTTRTGFLTSDKLRGQPIRCLDLLG